MTKVWECWSSSVALDDGLTGSRWMEMLFSLLKLCVVLVLAFKDYEVRVAALTHCNFKKHTGDVLLVSH